LEKGKREVGIGKQASRNRQAGSWNCRQLGIVRQAIGEWAVGIDKLE
jgi:hypothetical protein